MTASLPNCDADLHRRAVADAAKVFDRMMREVDAGARPSRPLWPAYGVSMEQLRPEALADLIGALGAYMDLVARAIQGSLDALWDDGGRSDPARAPVAMSSRAGESASGAVWIHNGSDQPVTDLELRLTTLSGADGTDLRPVCAAFTPRPGRVPSRSSAATVLSVLVPGETRPGVYSGQIVADALPGARVPLRLVVQP
jgi:hypothetical protein